MASVPEIVCSADGCEAIASHLCSACVVKKYCSPLCQEADWKAGHKTACSTTTSAAKKTEYGGEGTMPSLVSIPCAEVGEKNAAKDAGKDAAKDVANPAKGRLTIGGSTYEGDIVDGKANGKGTLHKRDPAGMTLLFYEGGFKDNLKHGAGKLDVTAHHNEFMYEGNFKDGKYHGVGRLCVENGDCYTGGFKDGKYHGAGTMMTEMGDAEIKGTWKNGKMIGKAKMETDEGLYEGYFSGETPHGMDGKLTFPNGDVYVGAFEDGEMAGDGQMTSADGAVEIFKDGQPSNKRKLDCVEK